MILNAQEDVNNNLIWDIAEPFIEVAHSSFRVLFENLELGVLFVQFGSDLTTNNISEQVLKSQFITVVILDGQNHARMQFGFSLVISFLPHHSN